jgi:hypothetical protein
MSLYYASLNKYAVQFRLQNPKFNMCGGRTKKCQHYENIIISKPYYIGLVGAATANGPYFGGGVVPPA